MKQKKFKSPKFHDCAHTHVTGESEYVDDKSIRKNELFMEVFYSTRAHAKITKLDLSVVNQDPNVIATYTGDDFYDNRWGSIFQDQPLLATDKVQFAGEPIVIIVATSVEAAQYAKQKVIIEYEDLPAVLSIQQAKVEKSFIADARYIKRGDAKQALAEAKHQLKGDIKIQGADHFYLESQVSIAYPLEDGQIEVHSSSQHPTNTSAATT